MTPLQRLTDLAGASIDAIGAALADIPGLLTLNHDTHRIAVTGLQRAGKTVFVTSFVHALLQAADAPVADFPFFPWRGQVQGVTVEDIPGIPPFPYRARLDELLGEPPKWPAPTTGLTGVRVRIRYTPPGGLTRMLFSTATVDLDLIDYPGEWLLDLPMLTQSYQEWSARMEELANAGGRSDLSWAWLEEARRLDPDAPEDPAALQRIGALYLEYIRRCRSERHLHFVQPGRFLAGAGDDTERGPVFFPLGRIRASKAGSNGAALVARYEAYRKLVRRFYGQVFGRLRRQVVLVDLLTALQNGRESFADLALATQSLTDAFEALENPILKALSLGGVDRLALVATKADHVTADQMNNMIGLLRDMIGEPFVQANARQSGLFAAASLRATTQVMRKWQGEALPFLLGVPEGRDGGQGGAAIEVRPGVIPGQIPAAADFFWTSMEFNIRQFAPPRLGTPYARPLPHINLDKILQFLIA
ncbi:YcjX family protein [Reyranella sp.]|uniref:YcjX family protein n=1 Tax=Reyranella sp. TaxID=1929291 RepID=UPI003D0F7540